MTAQKDHGSAPAASAALITFDFHGDQLAVVTRDGEHFAVLARVCEPLGVDVDSQRNKLRKQPWACTAIITAHDSSGREQDLFCLALKSLPMWLASINTGKVRPELREKLAMYQRECADVLADHFLGRRGASQPASPGLTAEQVSALVRAELRAAMAVQADAPPGLGRGAARLHVLQPLLEIARRRARAFHNTTPQAVQSLRAIADRNLRRAVGFPGDSRQSWDRFPRARLADLLLEIAAMAAETEKLLAISSAGAKQGDLPFSKPN